MLRTSAGLRRRRQLLVEKLEDRRVFAALWRNAIDSLDVDGDRFIAPADALEIINELNGLGSRQLPATRGAADMFLDPSGDRFVAPDDALLVINYLNDGQGSQRRLQEGSAFLRDTQILIGLGQVDAARIYRLQIDALVDRTDTAPALEDVLAVYLVDPENPTQTILDRGVPGTALFTLAGDQAEYPAGRVTWDGSILQIDLTELADYEAGLLKIQLLNSDSDVNTRFVITPLSNELTEDGAAAPVFARRTAVVDPAGPASTNLLTTPTNVQAHIGNVRFDPTTGIYAAELSVDNDGPSLGSQFVVAFPGLPSGVELTNASGVLPSGVPYVNLRQAIEEGGLASGRRSAPVRLTFSNPDQQRFSLTPQLLAGQNHAPTLEPIGPLVVLPGDVVRVPLLGADVDGDRLTYSIRGAGGLPNGRLRSDGVLELRPAPHQLGRYEFVAAVSDGALEATRSVTLDVVADPITTTRVSGLVLDVDGTPLVGVQVEIGAVQGLTAADGSFTLDLGSGPVVGDTLKVRGELIGGPHVYPFIAEKLDLVLEHDVYDGVNNVLAAPVYLPKIDVAGGEAIDPEQDVEVGSDSVPGASLFVSAGTLFNQQGSPFTGVMSITEVPVDRTPIALPVDLIPDLVVTIQPSEMVFASPAPLVFPNRGGWAPGAILDLWSINPTTGEFEDVGDMQVSPDGLTLVTIAGGIRNSSWHFPAPPPDEPNPDDDADEDDDCDECKETAPGTSEIELHSGALIETHDLVAYQSLGRSRGFSLRYDSLRADPRPIVSFGYSDVPAASNRRLVATVEIDRGDFIQQVPGYAGDDFGLSGGEHVWTIPQSGDIRASLQLDLRDAPTGVYDYVLRSGILQFDGQQFTGTTRPTAKQVRVVNYIDSPFGAGWGLDGLERIHENSDGSLLVVDGGGSELFFGPAADVGEPYDSPPGDFTNLVKTLDGGFRRTTPDQTVTDYDPSGRLTQIVDRYGNATTYEYDGDGVLQRIVDPVGLTTQFVRTGSRITSIVDPAGRVTQLVYDANGDLTRVVDPDGSQRTWGYDDQHRMTSEVDKRGEREEASYGFAGRVESVVRRDGAVLEYDPVQTQYLKRPSATSNPLAPPPVELLAPISARYADDNGNVVEHQLDKQGQSKAGRDAAGSLGGVARNMENQIVERRDGRGYLTAYEYDERGNLITVTDSAPVRGRELGGGVNEADYENPGDPALRDNTGFTANALGPNDDNSTSLVSLGFTVNFYGQTYDRLYVNNNGNVTFDAPQSTYTPFNLLSTTRVILAPFFADVDTRGAGTVTYGVDQVAGRDAFGVHWNGVGYYSSNTDKTNSFQLVVVDRSDILPGDFDFEFNYERIEWETGDASDGVDGLGGNSARAGYSNGDDRSYEIDGSAVDGALLDANLESGLIHNQQGSVIPGRYRFEVRNGVVGSTSVTRYTYDPVFNQMTSMIDAEGRRVDFEIDPDTGDRLASIQVFGLRDDVDNGETDDLVTTFTYDARGLVQSSVDPRGVTTEYDYDARGLLTMVRRAVGTALQTTETYEYDAAGNVAAMVDAAGARTEFAYDAANRLTRIDYPDPDGPGPLDAPFQTTVYDAAGNVASETDPLGRTWTYSYDAFERLLTTVGPDPDGAGPANSPVTENVYDAAGNLAATVDPNGEETRYRHDARNRRIETIDPDGGVVRFGYDADDNLIRVVDPLGQITRYVYDMRDRLVLETDPLGESTQYFFDSSNNLVRKIDRNDRTVRYGYDDANRLVVEQWVDDQNAIVKTMEQTYDAAGDLLSVVDEQSELVMTYDALRRVTTATSNGSGAPEVVIAYGYDAVGNVIEVADAIDGQDGATTTYSYDALRRATSIAQSGTDTDAKRVDLLYNRLGQYSEIARFSDLTATDLVARTRFTYDGRNRLAALEHGASSVRDLAFYDFEYDAADRITAITDVDGRSDFDYDARDQLTGVGRGPSDPRGDESYAYDDNGNRTDSHRQSDIVVGPGNRTLADGTYAYEYDDEGNVVKRTDTAAGTYREFKYDHLNRLLRATDFSAGGVITAESSYVYDGHGRQIAQSVDPDGAGAQTSLVQYFYYDREDLLLLLNDSDGGGGQPAALATRYFHGAGIDQPFSQETPGAGAQWLLTDQLGSVRDVVDSNGDSLQRIAYDAFGNIAFQSNVAFDLRHRFTGREYDTAVGLYQYRSRHYDSSLGLFLSEDPAGQGFGEWNPRRYVMNNPVGNADPFGLYFGIDDAVFAGGGALVGLLGQGVADLIGGQMSGWEDYTAAALGGAAGGEALLYTGPVGAGIAAGAVTNLTKQGLKNLTGKQCGFDWASLGVDSAIGGLTGLIPGLPIRGVTTGRGSMNQIYKQIVTKAQNGSISTIRPSTAAKMFAGRAADTSLVPGAAVGGAAGVGASKLLPGSDKCGCQ